MRADRLLAVLLLLQQREQVTAAEVAHEREVEARTAPYKGRALFARRYDMLPVMGGSSQQTYCRIGGRYPRPRWRRSQRRSRRDRRYRCS